MLDALDGVSDVDRAPSWSMTEDRIGTASLNNLISLWMNFKRHNVMPDAGGWLDQPLDFISSVEVLDYLMSVKRKLMDTEFSNLDDDEIAFLHWIAPEDE